MWVLALATGSWAQEPPEESPQALIRRFVSGDDAAGPRLRGLGPAARLLLDPYRKEPRVRDLLRVIREEAATPEDRKLGARLSGLKARLGGGQGAFAEAAEALMGDGVRCIIDPREYEVIAAAQVALPGEGSSLSGLEEICHEAGTDFAFLYGAVVIARPDRLWPPLPAQRRTLSAPETARAKALVSKLGSEGPEERDRAAAELRGLGEPGLPILEAGASDRDPEIAGRCRGLAEELRPKPAPLFRSASAELQTLTGKDAELLATLRAKPTTFRVKDLLLRHALSLLLSQVDLSSTVGKVPEVKLSFSFENVSYAAILAVLTQCVGLDYLIEGGHLVVGPREEIVSRLKR